MLSSSDSTNGHYAAGNAMHCFKKVLVIISNQEHLI